MSGTEDIPDYPPTWAYPVAVLCGCIILLGLGAAYLFARRWPSEGWRWGLWCGVPAWALVTLLDVGRMGVVGGFVQALPVLLYVALCCGVAAFGARRLTARTHP